MYQCSSHLFVTIEHVYWRLYYMYVIHLEQVLQLCNRIKRIVQNAIFDSFTVKRYRTFQTRRTKIPFTIPIMAKITTL